MMKKVLLLKSLIAFLIVDSTEAQTTVVLAKNNHWGVLGSKYVDRKVDRDLLIVGANEGKFTKLRVKVTGGPVHIHSMIVTYGNGQRDTIPLRHHFRKGSESRIIDLHGRRRVIKHISFVYEQKRPAKRAKVWVVAK